MPLAVRPNGVEVLGLAPRLLALLQGTSHYSQAPSLERDEARVLARIDRVLRELRDAKRHSVAILDTHCGRGDLLIAAAEHARRLGFTAVDVRGYDHSARKIGLARFAALHHTDPAIGFTFEQRDYGQPLDADDGAFDVTLTDEMDSAEVSRVGGGGVLLRH